MSATDSRMSSSPFGILAEYEQRSLGHDPGLPEEVEARGLWRGIGFRMGERHFLGSIADIIELLEMPALTRVPGSKPWILGIANVRGNLVSVMDLGQFLTSRRTQLTSRSRVLLVHQPGAALGLLVDEVIGQRSVTSEQLAGLAGEEDPALQPYVAGSATLGNQSWAIFNISDFVKASQFQQAAV